MEPQFIYFDMGNVLLYFSHERMAQEMARVTGKDWRQAWRVLFEGNGGLHWAYERGELAPDQFYGRFCELVGARAPRNPSDRAALDAAGSDIFWLNVPMVGLVGRLSAAGYRLGVFSNTTVSHWQHCTSRFGMLTTMFPVHALSYQLRTMKPAPEAYRRAADLAGVEPERILFADDRADNVEAARQAGWDAVQYESVSHLNEALRNRGVRMNY